MNKSTAEGLINAFPQFFDHFKKKYKYPHSQLSVGEGWSNLICKMLIKLDYHRESVSKKYKKHGTTVTTDFVQIKEKFGTLRLYHNTTVEMEPKSHQRVRKIDMWIRDIMCRRGFAKAYWAFYRWRRRHFETISEQVNTIIGNAEAKSAKICERCGEEGERCRPDYWVMTLCKKCENKLKKKGEQNDKLESGLHD